MICPSHRPAASQGYMALAEANWQRKHQVVSVPSTEDQKAGTVEDCREGQPRFVPVRDTISQAFTDPFSRFKVVGSRTRSLNTHTCTHARTHTRARTLSYSQVQPCCIVRALSHSLTHILCISRSFYKSQSTPPQTLPLPEMTTETAAGIGRKRLVDSSELKKKIYTHI